MSSKFYIHNLITIRYLIDLVFFFRYKHNPSDYRHKKSCPSCLKWYKTLNGIEFHYRSIHLNKPGGLCKICDKSFKNRKAFKYHMLAHDEIHAYICDICKQK